MRQYKVYRRKRKYLQAVLICSIASLIMPVIALVILLSWEEFRLPVLGDFQKKMLLLVGMGIFLWITVALVSLYIMFRIRKSHAGLRSKGWGIERCEFCQRSLNTVAAPRLIKDHIVCAQCYAKIEKERQEVRGEGSP